MDHSYTFTFKVDASSIDNLGHVNNVNYLKWTQLIAEKHWTKLSNSSIDEKYVWVVLRHEIDYFSAAFLNDEITLKTWIGGSYGVKSDRYVNVMRNGEILCSTKTIWCLLDKATMKPFRIPLEIMGILTLNKMV
ncbi:acyl-CoA thioesterase [Lutibacter flavus]|uniref:Acyl-CoA thioester hydrolase n=1 Tax=Lutibacter flavus TaxID=691689 RepID=A0A238VNU4_9FLAO|nr:thioesterase family protein [Lutibacter flavus]SNR36025.1 acyl-CoA thioester hydrolase [Lutibacter flavus]